MQRIDGGRALLFTGATALGLAAATAIGPVDALARATTVRVFNLSPAEQYEVSRNGSVIAAVASSAAASLVFDAAVSAGDVVTVGAGGDLQPPAPPLFTGLESPTPGCARATWLPSGDPTVVGYSIGYGSQSVASGQATQYEYTMDVGAATVGDVCQLAAGTYYFAVRARNQHGLTSAYSGERAVQIVNASVVITKFDARVQGKAVRLTWRIEAGEPVSGLQIYRSENGAPELPLSTTQLDADRNSFVDRSTRPGTAYRYVLAVFKESGGEVRSPSVALTTPGPTLSLEQNMPNPCNPSTTIWFELPEASRATVRVYDVRGSRVATVFEDDLPAGRHSATWDGMGESGAPVASGTYFYVLTAGDLTRSRKMVVVK